MFKLFSLIINMLQLFDVLDGAITLTMSFPFLSWDPYF